jgi:hypothetical protein
MWITTSKSRWHYFSVLHALVERTLDVRHRADTVEMFHRGAMFNLLTMVIVRTTATL